MGSCIKKKNANANAYVYFQVSLKTSRDTCSPEKQFSSQPAFQWIAATRSDLARYESSKGKGKNEYTHPLKPNNKK